MKAIVYGEYGSPDVLELAEVDRPVVHDDNVLVRVHAASVNAYDWHMMRGHPYLVRVSEGLRRPKRPAAGVDFAGHVEAVGKNVTQFQPGDAVYGERSGAFAEYLCATETRFVRMPANVSYEQAAAVPMAGLTALQGLRDKGRVQPGQRVLVNGAAGGVGTFAVQIAKALGAHVTGVCSTRNVDLVRGIGADQVIDYTRDDFSKLAPRSDVLLDVAGNRSMRALRRALEPEGRLVIIGAPRGNWIAPLTPIVKAIVLSRFVRQELVPFLAKHNNDDLVFLREMIESGKVTPVIDRTYKLSEVPDAVRYVEGGHAQGKVVITI
jgi:NADPH:quinone reductase-like Zn-dependent oxidoreductase